MEYIFEAILEEKSLSDAERVLLIEKHAQAPSKPLAELLREAKIPWDKMSGVFERVYHISSIDLSVYDKGKKGKEDLAIAHLPYELARRYRVFPIELKDETLFLASGNPLDLQSEDELATKIGRNIKMVYADAAEVDRCIERYYSCEQAIQQSAKEIAAEDKDLSVTAEPEEKKEESFNLEELIEGKSPVVKLVNLILMTAVRKRSSDIHIEPQEDAVHVRIRVDGVLQHMMLVPNGIRAALTARIKIISELNITETRKTQDGRIAIKVDDRKIDVRVSVLPTHYGEKVVLRLLDRTEARLHLDKIEMPAAQLKLFMEAASRPQGMMLVTGPTGSGKTSTLYAALNHIKQGDIQNIMTIEDPVEYLLEGINQVQVNPIKDLTFAAALRSILRQDPNVILVGEIRDRETAEIAMRSALTGHLVLSSVHTLNSIAAITRLVDIGVEPYLIASSLLLIVAQRLVRVICSNCRGPYTPSQALIEKYHFYLSKYSVNRFSRGAGCHHCGNTGYLGRTAVFEMLPVNEKIRRLIGEKAFEDVILKEAWRSGFNSLAENGIEKVGKGITTLEELDNVVELTEVEKNLTEAHKKILTEEPKPPFTDPFERH